MGRLIEGKFDEKPGSYIFKKGRPWANGINQKGIRNF